MQINQNKNKRTSVQDFTKLTTEKVQDQFMELIKIAQCADVANMSHLSLDARFKSPFISNHLKRIKDSCEAVKTELRNNPKFGFKDKDTDYTETAAGELYDLLSNSIRFGTEGLERLNENLRLHLEHPEKMNETYARLNAMSTDPLYISGLLVKFAASLLERAGTGIHDKLTDHTTSNQAKKIVVGTEYQDLLKDCLTGLNFEVDAV